ncbi:MAG: hypothetical protein WD872_02890 [Pirellulaceae bacterium]
MTENDYPYDSPPDATLWQPPPVALLKRDDEPAYRPPLAVIVAIAMLLLSAGNAMHTPIAEATDGPGQPGFLSVAFVTFAIAGSIAAQAALLAILTVYGAGPLWLRLARHWGLAAVAFIAWCVGFTLAYVNRLPWAMDGEALLVAVAGLPLIALACQGPHWLMRIYFYWRIEHSDQNANAQSPRPLTIRDFFFGTVVVAATMAAVRLGKPALVDEGEYWLGWTLGGAVAAGISLIVVVPIAAFALAWRDWRWGAFGIGVLAAVAIAAASAGLIYLTSARGSNDWLGIFIATSLVIGFFLTLAIPLAVARAYGYRLVTRRRAAISAAAPPPAIPPIAPAPPAA